MPRNELTSLSPFKGELEGGIGSHRYYQHAEIPHPHPGPPLEGEGDFAWLNNVANQENG